MPRLALLPIGLFIIWSFVCQRWYVCHIKNKCEATEQSEEAPPPAAIDNRPLVFNWSDASPQTRSHFDAFRDSLLKALPEDKLFEIVGAYYPKEETPEGFANMGLARADALKNLFQDGLDEGRIVASSKPFADVPEPVEGAFTAAEFNYKDIPKEDKVEIIKVANQISILFPYGSATKEPDPKVEEYLSTLAERLKQTTETVTITGHTDNSGSEEYNMSLGLARAKHIQQILRGKGISADRIAVSSKGESEPVASNDTEEGGRQNRRVVLVLKQQ
jgi:OmpA-OmpF porin, OOP family